ncbi:MFS transporter [Bosea psychrotolerans]|uniref:Sugar phosphate permease n=1 Tax=Bosea psychrotolerans TaxID=1871628 RepID=A0A2S4MAQ8_9HYPH|nr:MFS transporter [Bosea psychrotolerans]POR51794.1 sugar phosphate permease [Bosea psychrotolerans]
MQPPSPHWSARLPFYYGWLIIGIAFVTMAVAVSARTAFSLLLPPLIDEFGWDRGLASGAFSFGFLLSAATSTFVGRVMDKHGPRVVIETGVAMLAAGMLVAPAISAAWHLYLTLGVLVGCGANLMSFSAQSLFLPNWFVRRRAFAISIAFSGVGVGAVLLLPWLQSIISREGWRAACWIMGLLVLLVLGPLNLLVRRRPQDLGLLPDGETGTAGTGAARRAAAVVDPAWVASEWTLARALRTARLWWIMLGYFCALVAWYAVQVHQTKYLIEVGFTPLTAAWALGLVSAVAIPGQIGLGALSDRIGREWIWMVGCLGFAICYAALIALEHSPSPVLLYVMVIAQGFLGYALASVMGAIVAEIFEGPHFGAIFGTVTVALLGGGAVGPWLAGAIHDATGSYRLAFLLAIACCFVSAAAIWLAAPRHVRLVPGRVGRRPLAAE